MLYHGSGTPDLRPAVHCCCWQNWHQLSHCCYWCCCCCCCCSCSGQCCSHLHSSSQFFTVQLAECLYHRFRQLSFRPLTGIICLGQCLLSFKIVPPSWTNPRSPRGHPFGTLLKFRFYCARITGQRCSKPQPEHPRRHSLELGVEQRHAPHGSAEEVYAGAADFNVGDIMSLVNLHQHTLSYCV